MNDENESPEFWEVNFIEKGEMWGLNPSQSALITRDFFVQQGVKKVLVPGFGYGRNAEVFREAGMQVTGIEISKTAIEIAKKQYGDHMTIYHGSVTDMPFNDDMYDGIFCYALVHLLDENEREKLIDDCYRQLSGNGYMFFVAISKEAHTYGQGNFISKDRYEIFPRVKMFFYDRESIHAEFGRSGLFNIVEVEENYPFYLIQCRKDETGSRKVNLP